MRDSLDEFGNISAIISLDVGGVLLRIEGRAHPKFRNN